MPRRTFIKTLEHVEAFSHFQSRQVLTEIRNKYVNTDDETLKLREFEFAVLVNLCPETAEEAKTLIPTLDRFDDEQVTQMVNDLAAFKEE